MNHSLLNLTARLTARLWSAAWAGEVTNDTFAPLRKGVLGRFRPTPVETASRWASC